MWVDGRRPPEWPEPFWIPQLERFVAGGGCDVPPPPPPSGPAVGCPAPGWIREHAVGSGSGSGSGAVGSPEAEGCCTLLSADLNRTGCGSPLSPERCAHQQCDDSPTKVKVWKPKDYNHHPYTCCAK